MSFRTNLLPSLTGRPPLNNTEKNLLGLPARLGLLNPSTCDHNFENSRKVTEPQRYYPLHKVISRDRTSERIYETVKGYNTRKQQQLRAMDLAEEKGAAQCYTEYGRIQGCHHSPVCPQIYQQRVYVAPDSRLNMRPRGAFQT